MWRQWQKAINYLHSVQTYQDLSPDLSMRQQVNRFLSQHRRPLSQTAWCDEFYQATRSQNDILLFVYRSLETYSGIEFNRVRPHDRLVDDLQFPMVCWFDWSITFCDDVVAQFGIDISDCFDETCIETLADLILFLETRLENASAALRS
ncbi:MAG: hypothetical protein AAF572_28215 [Cyanobacteria bacterium P01_B01_bin.77]